jgi:hypothetical protein
MNSYRDRVLFWLLIAVQAAGSQTLVWFGLPIYHRLQSAEHRGASPKEFALAIAAVLAMQLAHWPALALRRRLEFRRNVVLGHVLIWIGELSLFFIGALSTLILFDRFAELEFAFWKPFALAMMLFAITSYKYQLMSLGEVLIKAAPGKPTNQ